MMAIVLSDAAYSGDLNVLAAELYESGWRLKFRCLGRSSVYHHKFEFDLIAERSADDGRPDFAKSAASDTRSDTRGVDTVVELLQHDAAYWWQDKHRIYAAGRTLKDALTDLRAAVAAFNAVHPQGLVRESEEEEFE